MPTQSPTESSRGTIAPSPTKEAAALSAEGLSAQTWRGLVEKYQYSWPIETKVLENTDVNDEARFKIELTEFLLKFNTLPEENEAEISYNPGEPSEIYLRKWNEDRATRVRFDGVNLPSFIPQTFHYNQEEGVCAAVADEPASGGAFQGNEVKFDPQNPQNCFGIGHYRGRKIIVGFFPNADGVDVKAAIFSEDADR